MPKINKTFAGVSAAAIAKLEDAVEDWLITEINNGSFSVSSPHTGSAWITIVDGSHGSSSGYVASLYFHPSQEHSATTIGSLGPKKSKAAAGEWAVSVQTKAHTGNKALYNTAGTADWE